MKPARAMLLFLGACCMAPQDEDFEFRAFVVATVMERRSLTEKEIVAVLKKQLVREGRDREIDFIRPQPGIVSVRASNAVVDRVEKLLESMSSEP